MSWGNLLGISLLTAATAIIATTVLFLCVSQEVRGMSRKLMEIFESAESRYLTADERRAVVAYAQSLPKRLAAAVAVEQAEDQVVRLAIERLRKSYPNMEKYHVDGWSKGVRDMQLVLRHVTLAMVADDLSDLDDRLLFWFRSILAAVNLTPKFVREGYTYLMEACRQKLPAESFAYLEPCLQHVIDSLSDFPEPHVAAV
jgi:hypothetical protein